jgi:hypothetical protein
MTRNWKPGDVAMVRGDVCIRRSDGAWEHGREDVFAHPAASDARPLVVIDPESDEDVDRLRDALWPGGTFDVWQDRIRELANPTLRIEEPAGLGAVVEDAAGGRYVRVTPENLSFPGEVWETRYGGERWLTWSDVKAVRVLSEGIS